MTQDATTPALVRLATALGSVTLDEHFAVRLCEVARTVLGADGAALTMDFTLGHRVALASTDSSTERLEQLQEIVGEGPGRDASRSGAIHVATVSEPSLDMWPHLAGMAVQAGLVGTYWAVPLQPARLVIGVLTLHCAEGWLTEDLDTVQVVANAVGTALLRDPRLLAPEQDVAGSWAERSRIHQATGMVVAQLNVPPDDAIAVMRAHAYASNRSLIDISRSIIDRHLDFTDFLGPSS